MAQRVVCGENVLRYYGKNPEMKEVYRNIAASGKCPFCPGNIENKPVGIGTAHWNVVHNKWKYKNAKWHFLLLPKRHVTSIAEMTAEEMADLWNAVALVVKKYPSAAKGYGLCVRVDEVGGVTLYHLHFHLIVPKIGRNGQIPVNFGIG